MTTIDDTRAVFREWLYLPDTGALDAVLGAVAANRLDGDPVWLLLVGPPGGGKSEILNAITGLHDAHPTGTLTEASLLSGTPKKEHADSARGGLLRNIGDFGIIVAKDFGSVLSMNRDARAQLLAALREVYDRRWTRHVGTDGGRTLDWEGKVGLVGGVTPTIDRHHAVMGAMGERFVLYRLPEVDPDTQARRALSHAGQETRMRKELAAAVQALLESAGSTPRITDEAERTRLVGLATLAVRARSAVERDNYSREIELVPGPEAPTRLIVVLDRMLAGLDVIGVSRTDAWKVITKLALDSVPALRLAILNTLKGGQADTNDISGKVLHPASTTRRALEDLVAHGLVELERQESPKPHLWALSAFTTTRMQDFPETSEETEVFPEVSESKNGKPLISSSKEQEQQNGKDNNQQLLQQTLDDPNLSDEDRELISRYVLEPAGLAPEPEDPPADLWDDTTPNDNIPF
jgi:energy-coupling factor transporter ATP-binding protein EcfA2